MRKNKRKIIGGFRSVGFTIAEMLIALAISAMLLAAIAIAFNASFMNYTENENLFHATNKARQALQSMTLKIRTAQAVDPNSTSVDCTLVDSQGSDITYSYDASLGKLFLVTNDDLTDDNYLMCDDLSAMAFEIQTAVKDAITYVKSVQISMTVTVDQTEKTLSTAVVLRKNLD